MERVRAKSQSDKISLFSFANVIGRSRASERVSDTTTFIHSYTHCSTLWPFRIFYLGHSVYSMCKCIKLKWNWILNQFRTQNASFATSTTHLLWPNKIRGFFISVSIQYYLRKMLAVEVAFVDVVLYKLYIYE